MPQIESTCCLYDCLGNLDFSHGNIDYLSLDTSNFKRLLQLGGLVSETTNVSCPLNHSPSKVICAVYGKLHSKILQETEVDDLLLDRGTMRGSELLKPPTDKALLLVRSTGYTGGNR
ncbi:hypothetical protein V2G26_000372 [Clonostachys chloroleuca]